MIKMTQLQKAMAFDLMKKAEYDTSTCTIMHRRLGVPEKLIGKPIKHWFDDLTSQQGSDIIRELKAQLA